MSLPLFGRGSVYAAGAPRQPRAFRVAFQGLEFNGEIFATDQWDAALGRPLEGDAYFRVVMLQSRTPVPTGDIQDSRIAVCIPTRDRPLAGSRGRAAGQLAALRETQAAYITKKDPETAFIRGYLEKQTEDLKERLVSEEGARYAGGHIESAAVLSGPLSGYFEGPDPDAWYRRIAEELLAWAYPEPPIDSSLLSRPITPEDVARVYGAILAPDMIDPAPLEEFGPALGISKLETPGFFDPGNCRVFTRIQSELEEGQRCLVWKDVHSKLAHGLGLTGPLASLYLMAFAYHSGAVGRPEIEIELEPEHRLDFVDGRPVRGRKLTWEFIPYLPWQPVDHGQDARFARSIRSRMVPTGDLSWDDALQYTSLLCQGLTETGEGAFDLAAQERELLDVLAGLAKDIEQTRMVREKLRSKASAPDEGQLVADLDLLSEVCGGRDYEKVYDLARGLFGGPKELDRALTLLKQLLYLGNSLSEIMDMKSFLGGSESVAKYEELSVDRAALLEQMSLPSLLSGTQAWQGLRARIGDYRRRYRRTYIDHHGTYQGEVSLLLHSLDECQRKLHALTLLNTIAELGEPVGAGLVQDFLDLEERIRRCDRSLQDTPLTSEARCPGCGMALGEWPPSSELELFARQVDGALGNQNRRLSRVLVDRILHGRIDQRIRDLLEIVRASDLSALSNTLNNELVLFIRQMLENK